MWLDCGVTAQALQTIEHTSEDSQSVIAGDLNVTCASAQGRVHLLPLITKFLAHYPKINVSLQLNDRFVDMVAANLDLSRTYLCTSFTPKENLYPQKYAHWLICY